jgi:hypothetical protein
MDKIIVVVKERWVLIGEVKEKTAQSLQLTNTSVIRVWGTERGLGQIAVSGPQPETILDFCGDVEINLPAVLFTIKCL